MPVAPSLAALTVVVVAEDRGRHRSSNPAQHHRSLQEGQQLLVKRNGSPPPAAVLEPRGLMQETERVGGGLRVAGRSSKVVAANSIFGGRSLFPSENSRCDPTSVRVTDDLENATRRAKLAAGSARAWCLSCCSRALEWRRHEGGASIYDVHKNF